MRANPGSIFGSLGLPALALAVLGAAVALRSQPRTAALPLTMIVALVAEIQFHPLHWARWLLPVLPPLALLIALGVSRGAALVAPGARTRPVIVAAFVALVVGGPACALVRLALQQREPSTRVAARAWVIANVPSGASIAQEWYTAALDRLDFVGYVNDRTGPVRSPREGWWAMLWQRQYLAEDADVDTYRRRRVDYILTSSTIRERYAAEPARYARELGFYARLDAEAALVAEIAPSARRAGPTIRVYRLVRPTPGAEDR